MASPVQEPRCLLSVQAYRPHTPTEDAGDGAGVCISGVGRGLFVEHAQSRRVITKAATWPMRFCSLRDISERILQRTHGGKDLNAACIGRQVPRQRCADFRKSVRRNMADCNPVRPREWMARWDGRLRAIAVPCAARCWVAVAGFQAEGKCAVGFGVFVPATNLRVRSQRCQFVQELSICSGCLQKSRPQPTLNRVSPQNSNPRPK